MCSTSEVCLSDAAACTLEASLLEFVFDSLDEMAGKATAFQQQHPEVTLTDYDMMCLDKDGNRVSSDENPGADRFPFRIKFTPKQDKCSTSEVCFSDETICILSMFHRSRVRDNAKLGECAQQVLKSESPTGESPATQGGGLLRALRAHYLHYCTALFYR